MLYLCIDQYIHYRMMTRLRVILCGLLFCLSFQSIFAEEGHPARRLKVGLVLGGGGAKGAAHPGVLREIEKLDIPIDYIAGTSIGSIVGGLYACGYRSDDIEQMFRSQEWLSLLTDRNNEFKNRLFEHHDSVTYILGFPVSRERKRRRRGQRQVGALRGDHVVALLDSMLQRPDSISFDSLPIPFRCVAVDVRRMRQVVLSSGRLSTAMRASMSIPGAFKPVRLDSMLLVDGGVLNNLPVDVVREMGADVVIAIDLTQNKHEDRKRKGKEAHGFAALLDWLGTRPDITTYNHNRADADVYINPDLRGYDAMSFKPMKINDMLSIGVKAGHKSERDLKKLKKRIYFQK